MISPNTLLQNRYLIIRLLAQGGMGAVYEARDQRLGTTVALKETFFVEEELRKAFHREASILATLRHQALPKVIDHFNEGDGQFLVMEFIRGDDLSKLLEMHGGPIPQRDALMWADQVLGVLEYLHSQRPPVIHRDIKPQNLKLNEHGQVILLDFGLAKEAALETSRVYRSVRGYTLNYSPLEQIQGLGTDPRSDLYGVAATFYHLMTGVVPADAITRATALVESRPDPLRSAHELNPKVSPAVAAVLEQALSQDRNRRPPTATAMREALRKAVIVVTNEATVQPTVPQQPTPATAPPKFTQASQPRVAEPLSQPPNQDFQRIAEPLIQPQSQGFQSTSPPARRRTGLWIAGAAIAALVVITAFVIWSNKLRGIGSESAAKITSDPSSSAGIAPNAGKTIQLETRELLARGSEEERYYSFIAQGGEIKFTLDVLGNGATVAIEAIDTEKQLMRFNGNQTRLSVSSSGEHEQAVARMIVDHEQPIMLRLQTPFPKSLQAFRLRIDGSAKLQEAKSGSASTAPLAALFADRDRPRPLVSDTIFGGQGGKKETYYAFNAGPGEIKLTLNLIGNGANIAIELFDEDANHLRFSGGAQRFSLSSSEFNEQGSARLLLDRQQKLLMRIQNTFPQSTGAYRLKLDGPVQFTQAGENDSAARVAEALKPLFAPRDTPEQLKSKEISDRLSEKESYYSFTAGPGTLHLTIELEANGSIVSIALFDAEAKQLRFDDNSTRFYVSSSGKKEKKSVDVTFAREETVLMRISASAPDSSKNFRLKLDGAIKKL